ncbi:glycosyltransferase [Acidocella aromatica]|uniref:Glycosyltransferase involved in cell wall biosynthesis n=1 Tax=Acidocella aromatica TaxID=1303579 RepID=A0A840VSC6_9PROT|nr:glycosyltransferase [Acidocella aromatica]MBB5374220.1 glycosyltransferase involved in cell wall biosynthesis [Acidocella aromatica]
MGGTPPAPEGQMRQVAIFRHNLFKVSEPFITEQAEHLRRYHPLYVGRLRYGAPPPGAESLALSDLVKGWPIPFIARQMLTLDPAPYLRLLKGRSPALIHAHFGVEGVYALPVAKRLGVPLVTTFHGFDATLSTAALLASPAYAHYALGRQRLARYGQMFLCASDFIRERLLGMGFPAERTRVHYIGVDCGAIIPRAPEEEALEILHVARLVEVKGTEYLIRAFALAAPQHPNARLVIIGDGPLRAKLEKLAQVCGLAGRVAFLGAMPHAQVLARMRRAAMLVLSSVRTSSGRVEGLGMVTLEAAATGVPVIGSALGGIPEVVADGQTGFLVPERAPEALGSKIGALLGDETLRRNMGAAARERAAQKFDITRQTAVLEDLYDSLLEQE